MSLVSASTLTRVRAFLNVPLGRGHALRTQHGLITSCFVNNGRVNTQRVGSVAQTFARNAYRISFTNKAICVRIGSSVGSAPPRSSCCCVLQGGVPTRLNMCAGVRVRFSRQLCINSGTLRNGQCSVMPPPPINRDATKRLHANDCVARDSEANVSLRPRPNLSFRAKLRTTTIILRSDGASISLPTPRQHDTRGTLRTHANVIRDDQATTSVVLCDN